MDGPVIIFHSPAGARALDDTAEHPVVEVEADPAPRAGGPDAERPDGVAEDARAPDVEAARVTVPPGAPTGPLGPWRQAPWSSLPVGEPSTAR
jgi:hypothetical protein